MQTKKNPQFDFAVGGQAVLEGVMMRTPHYYIVSVRTPDGKIDLLKAPFSSIMDRVKWLKIPILRGVVHLIESMQIGFKALDFSSEKAFPDESPKKDADEKKSGGFGLLFQVFSLVFSLGLTLLLLKVLPLYIARFVADHVPYVDAHDILFNAIDGLTKMVIFLSYILLISLLSDIRRVFQYHGAEHKSIWTYEKGLPLTVEFAREQTRFHPRCGTSFIFLVILMSVVVYTFLPRSDSFSSMLALRLAVIPLIAGLGYEVLKSSAKYQNNPFVKLLTLPGLLFQRLTTKEPDDAQLEVALHSLQASLDAESLQSEVLPS